MSFAPLLEFGPARPCSAAMFGRGSAAGLVCGAQRVGACRRGHGTRPLVATRPPLVILRRAQDSRHASGVLATGCREPIPPKGLPPAQVPAPQERFSAILTVFVSSWTAANQKEDP